MEGNIWLDQERGERGARAEERGCGPPALPRARRARRVGRRDGPAPGFRAGLEVRAAGDGARAGEVGWGDELGGLWGWDHL